MDDICQSQMNGMNMNLLLPGLLLAVFSLTLTHCTDPIDIGGDLLDEDQASVGFTDTLSLKARTVAGDSISVYSFNSSALQNYYLGKVNDPYFGEVTTSLYLQPLLLRDPFTGLIQEFTPDPTAQVDSVVLVLPLDSSGVFGDVSGAFALEVYELTESIAYLEDDIYYSNTDLALAADPLAGVSIRPNFDTTFVTKLIVERSGDTASVGRQLRIPLSNSLGEFLLSQDSTFYQSDSVLLEQFRGLYVRPTELTGGLLDIDFARPWGGVHFYFSQPDTTTSYILPVNALSAHINRYEHDFSAGTVGDYLDNEAKGDSLLFLQGLEGLLVELEIPNLQELDGRAINKAELEFTVATLPGYDLDDRPPVDQILAYYRNDDGNLVVIDDVATGIDLGAIDLFFGGFPEEVESGKFTYRLNLSIHLQYMLNGALPETIYLAVFPRAANAGQVIFYGPGSSLSPARLKVAFTDL